MTCTNGVWRCRKYYGNRSRNRILGNIIKAVDSALRDRYEYRFRLRTEDVSKNIMSLIVKETDLLYKKRKMAEAPKIEIDLSQLDSIRKAAEITRDKLIVEEVTPDITEMQSSEPETVQEAENDSPLDAEESAFLKALLNGGDWKEQARAAGRMSSILADSINEKLFDLFGDTVIDFSDDTPVLIEDYTDELKGMFHI